MVQRYTNESKSKSSGDGNQKRGRKKLKVVELQPSTAWRWAKALNFADFENNQKNRGKQFRQLWGRWCKTK